MDLARGIAVLLMIEAHTFDAWTRPADRATVWFQRSAVLAGFAAPLFLWLAGLAVVLSAAATERRSGRAAAMDAVWRRGLEIFVLAFLFRLQAFTVSPGSHPITLFRVDILNIMGPAVFMAGIIWGLCRGSVLLAAVYAVCACAIAMLTPVVRTMALVGSLPTWLQWYIRPAGEHTTFTAFPWIGFVFAGAACGVPLVSASLASQERRLHAWLAVVGVALVTIGIYTASLPTLYRESSFWTSSPTYFAVRVGIIVMIFSSSYVLAQGVLRVGLTFGPLERLGRSSLFVYWIHVELVYGYAARAIRGRLPLWGTVAAYAAFTALMYGAVVARDRLVDAWRRRSLYRPPVPASALGQPPN